jgi:hypothetical protein
MLDAIDGMDGMALDGNYITVKLRGNQRDYRCGKLLLLRRRPGPRHP